MPGLVARLVAHLRRRATSLVQPVLPPDDQRRFTAERSSDGAGPGR